MNVKKAGVQEGGKEEGEEGGRREGTVSFLLEYMKGIEKRVSEEGGREGVASTRRERP